jgi:hypothetical protein
MAKAAVWPVIISPDRAVEVGIIKRWLMRRMYPLAVQGRPPEAAHASRMRPK